MLFLSKMGDFLLMDGKKENIFENNIKLLVWCRWQFIKKCVISYTQFNPSGKCCKAVLPLNNFFKILCAWIFSINRRKFENTFVLMILKIMYLDNISSSSNNLVAWYSTFLPSPPSFQGIFQLTFPNNPSAHLLPFSTAIGLNLY